MIEDLPTPVPPSTTILNSASCFTSVITVLYDGTLPNPGSGFSSFDEKRDPKKGTENLATKGRIRIDE